MYLTGWLYKASISDADSEKVVKAICEKFNDEECDDRLRTVKDTYSRREEKIKAQGKKLKTSMGLFEIYNDSPSEEEALEKIRELEEVLKTVEPNPSVIIELLNYERQIFAVVNFNKCEVLTATRDDEKALTYKDRIF